MRRAGVGRALLTAAETRAHELGCDTTEATSSRHRRGADAFYQRLGYRDISPRSARFLKRLDPVTR